MLLQCKILKSGPGFEPVTMVPTPSSAKLNSADHSAIATTPKTGCANNQYVRVHPNIHGIMFITVQQRQKTNSH